MSQLITVGIPVFNAMPYLPEALDSILGQSYRNFTVIAVDDGSTDSSLEYLRSIGDQRVRVYSQPNRGITATLNRILELTETPWLVRHDADDVAYSHRLKKVGEFIELYPSAGMFYSLADYHPRGKTVGTFRTTKGSPAELREITRGGHVLSICHPSVTLSVEKTRSLGGYRFDLNAEDVDLWWRMALKHDIQFIPEVTVGVRLASRNLSDQAVRTLYIQYLLVSELHDLRPLPYADAVPVLRDLLDLRRLQAKECIRRVNLRLSERRYFQASVALARAFYWSPSAFLNRVFYEFKTRPSFENGQDPEVFWQRREELWPLQARYKTSSSHELRLVLGNEERTVEANSFGPNLD
jgi:glycosyltransferase involved in cell wall biosynthesis